AAVWLRHPARLGDASDPQTAARIEGHGDRSEQTLAPERKACSLIFAVHSFQIRTDDRPAEHQFGHENLTGERTKLPTGVVKRDAVDRVRPIVRHPDRRAAGRLARVFALLL